MTKTRRVFILGAGFSKPAGMPLATELLPLILAKLNLEEMHKWLEGLQERLGWLSGHENKRGSFALNIEQVFHYAHFDIEVHRLRQHLAPVGRGDGPGTPWQRAKSVEAWLSYLEHALRDVIHESDAKSNPRISERGWSRALEKAFKLRYTVVVETTAIAWQGGLSSERFYPIQTSPPASQNQKDPATPGSALALA